MISGVTDGIDSSVVECMLSMQEASGSVPRTKHTNLPSFFVFMIEEKYHNYMIKKNGCVLKCQGRTSLS